MKVLAVCLMCVLLSQRAAAQSIFYLSEAVAVTGHAADLASTQHCLGAGRCHELNPLLARYDNPVAFSVAKFSVVSLQLWAVRKMRPTHPRLAILTNIAIGSGFLALGLHNQKVSNR